MENINELAKALALAQSEIGGAKKDSSNPFFKSKYADLESVWEACRAALTKNGLSISQLVGSDEKGLNLTTILLHSSGQSLTTKCSVPVAKQNDPQAAGSAITYFRRYQLAAIVGVYQTDDDANLASDKQTYRVPIGKHAGKTLTELSEAELNGMLEHLIENQTKLDQQAKDLLFRIKLHLKK